MNATITDFLLICIMSKTVKWIDILKYVCYQHQTRHGASGERDSRFYYKWAWSDEKHGRRQPKRPRKGRGLAIIGSEALTVCPIVTRLGGRLRTKTRNVFTKTFWAWPIGGATNIINV